jgi:hypothetical protein
LFDQFILAFPRPGLDLLLARNGVFDALVLFIIEKPVDFVFARKPAAMASPVLIKPALQVIGHAGV